MSIKNDVLIEIKNYMEYPLYRDFSINDINHLILKYSDVSSFSLKTIKKAIASKIYIAYLLEENEEKDELLFYVIKGPFYDYLKHKLYLERGKEFDICLLGGKFMITNHEFLNFEEVDRKYDIQIFSKDICSVNIISETDKWVSDF